MRKAAWKGGLALLLLLIVVVAAGCATPLTDAGWGIINADQSNVYYGRTDTGKLVALNAQSGLQVWEFPKDKTRLSALYGAPAVTDSLVIFGAADQAGKVHTVYALDKASGDPRWTFPPAGNPGVGPKDIIVGGPTVSGSTVYVTSADHNVWALDLQTGAVQWGPFTADGAVWSSAVRDGDRVFFGTMVQSTGRAQAGSSIYALNAADGTQAWRFQTLGAVPGTPAVAGGAVYVGDLSNSLYAIDEQSGSGKAIFKAKNWIWGQPLVAEGRLYVGSLDNNVYQVDPATGQVGWTFATKGAVRAGPAFAGGVLYVASEDQNLYAVTAATGQQKWAFPAGGALLAPPVVVGDAVYAVTSNGKALALDAATGTQRWVFPQPKQ